jgi:hypothetical protein
VITVCAETSEREKSSAIKQVGMDGLRIMVNVYLEGKHSFEDEI